jgi:hypothetical protein
MTFGLASISTDIGTGHVSILANTKSDLSLASKSKETERDISSSCIYDLGDA